MEDNFFQLKVFEPALFYAQNILADGQALKPEVAIHVRIDAAGKRSSDVCNRNVGAGDNCALFFSYGSTHGTHALRKYLGRNTQCQQADECHHRDSFHKRLHETLKCLALVTTNTFVLCGGRHFNGNQSVVVKLKNRYSM